MFRIGGPARVKHNNNPTVLTSPPPFPYSSSSLSSGGGMTTNFMFPIRDRLLRREYGTNTDPMEEIELIFALKRQNEDLTLNKEMLLADVTAEKVTSLGLKRELEVLQEEAKNLLDAKAQLEAELGRRLVVLTNQEEKENMITFLQEKVEILEKKLIDAHGVSQHLQDRLDGFAYQLRQVESQREKEGARYLDKQKELFTLLQHCNDGVKRGDGGGKVGDGIDEVRSNEIHQLRKQVRQLQSSYDEAVTKLHSKWAQEKTFLEDLHRNELARRDREVDAMRTQLQTLQAAKTWSTVANGASFEECLRIAYSQVDLLTKERDELESALESQARGFRMNQMKLENEVSLLTSQLATAKAEVTVLSSAGGGGATRFR
eukprot:PhF_6_TR7288/c0_g1_i3/m.10893